MGGQLASAQADLRALECRAVVQKHVSAEEQVVDHRAQPESALTLRLRLLEREIEW